MTEKSYYFHITGNLQRRKMPFKTFNSQPLRKAKRCSGNQVHKLKKKKTLLLFFKLKRTRANRKFVLIIKHFKKQNNS